jgi:CRP/FNR family transcriptional regulator, cyclic AMP receptor protein
MASEPLSSRFGRSFPAGEVLFREGEVGVEMFVIQTGKVRISKVFPSGERTLAVIGAGEFFGEMAILNAKPRTATATALEPLEALVIDGRTFEAMVLGNGEIAVRMITRLASRLHSANAYIDILSRADPRARVILGLARAGEEYGERVGGAVRLAMSANDLALMVGLDLPTVEAVIERLVRVRLVRPADDDAWLLPDPSQLQAFVGALENPGVEGA